MSDIRQIKKITNSMFCTPGTLFPGSVSTSYFKLLSNICCIRNNSMKKALADVLITGMSRRDACEQHGVSQSYFCVKYQYMQRISQMIVSMAPSIPEK